MVEPTSPPNDDSVSPLFNKMDALMARHRGTPAAGLDDIPVLTEVAPREVAIPVLTDVFNDEQFNDNLLQKIEEIERSISHFSPEADAPRSTSPSMDLEIDQAADSGIPVLMFSPPTRPVQSAAAPAAAKDIAPPPVQHTVIPHFVETPRQRSTPTAASPEFLDLPLLDLDAINAAPVIPAPVAKAAPAPIPTGFIADGLLIDFASDALSSAPHVEELSLTAFTEHADDTANTPLIHPIVSPIASAATEPIANAVAEPIAPMAAALPVQTNEIIATPASESELDDDFSIELNSIDLGIDLSEPITSEIAPIATSTPTQAASAAVMLEPVSATNPELIIESVAQFDIEPAPAIQPIAEPKVTQTEHLHIASGTGAAEGTPHTDEAALAPKAEPMIAAPIAQTLVWEDDVVSEPILSVSAIDDDAEFIIQLDDDLEGIDPSSLTSNVSGNIPTNFANNATQDHCRNSDENASQSQHNEPAQLTAPTPPASAAPSEIAPTEITHDAITANETEVTAGAGAGAEIETENAVETDLHLETDAPVAIQGIEPEDLIEAHQGDIPYESATHIDTAPEVVTAATLSSDAIAELTAVVGAQLAVDIASEVEQLTRQHFSKMMAQLYGDTLRELTSEISRELEARLAPRISELVQQELISQGLIRGRE